MMEHKFAEIENGVVTNISVADSPDWSAPGWVYVGESNCGVGWNFDGSNFTPPAKPAAEVRKDIDGERDAALAEGVLWNGRRWHMDDVMRSALMWRIQRWNIGRLAPDAVLPVRAMDNTIHMLGRDEHVALAEAIEATGAAIYAQSWAQKDALP